MRRILMMFLLLGGFVFAGTIPDGKPQAKETLTGRCGLFFNAKTTKSLTQRPQGTAK